VALPRTRNGQYPRSVKTRAIVAFCTLALVGSLAGVGASWGSSSAANTVTKTVKVCVVSKTNVVVSASSTGKCPKHTKTVSISRSPLPGPTGPKGDPGLPGPSGSDGKDGANGTNGADGRDGLDGTSGTDGASGSDGADGGPGPSSAPSSAIDGGAP
jgi:hypothetical protein